jgi:RNA polymerase sigma-70 factor (ECF subfamily)
MTGRERIDEKLLLEIMERQHDRVYKMAFTYMKNAYDAEDVYQIVFENYLLHQPTFENLEHEKAWFIRTTINACKNALTSGWRKRMVVSEDTVFSSVAQSEEEKDDERSEKLLAAVLKLPHKLSVVIQLFYYEEYSVKEIAEILHISVGTVTTRLNRARKKLEKSL